MEELDPIEAVNDSPMPSEAALSLLQKIVLKHKTYGFPAGKYSKKSLTELVDAELLTFHGSHYSVSPLGVEVFATL